MQPAGVDLGGVTIYIYERGRETNENNSNNKDQLILIFLIISIVFVIQIISSPLDWGLSHIVNTYLTYFD